MPNTNLNNATGSASTPVQITDANCMKVAQPLIHTHKQKRSTDRTLKRSRSSRSSSTESVAHRAKKRKLSKGRETFEKKRTIAKRVQQKMRPIRKSKSFRRGLFKDGHIKAGSRSKAFNRCFCRSIPRTRHGHKTKTMKPMSVKSRIRQYKSLIKKAQPTNYRRLRHKLGGSFTKSHTRAVSKSKGSSRSSKLQAPSSPHRSPTKCTKPTVRQAILRTVAARVTQCSRPYYKASSNKPRPVSILWANRLRPRPLKSARFACYSPSCFTQAIVTTAKPTSSPTITRPKRVRFVRKRANLQCGKNASNFDESLIAMQRDENRNEFNLCVTDGPAQQAISYSGLANDLAPSIEDPDRVACDHPVVSTTVYQDVMD